MNRPAFNISRLAGAQKNHETNNTQVTAIDGKGNTQTLNISPDAADQFITTLLASTPFGTKEQDDKFSKTILRARNTKVVQMQNSAIVLEVLLQPGIVIHIELPQLLAQALELQLGEFHQPNSGQSH